MIRTRIDDSDDDDDDDDENEIVQGLCHRHEQQPGSAAFQAGLGAWFEAAAGLRVGCQGKPICLRHPQGAREGGRTLRKDVPKHLLSAFYGTLPSKNLVFLKTLTGAF